MVKGLHGPRTVLAELVLSRFQPSGLERVRPDWFDLVTLR
jgi:hypothetical protein